MIKTVHTYSPPALAGRRPDRGGRARRGSQRQTPPSGAHHLYQQNPRRGWLPAARRGRGVADRPGACFRFWVLAVAAGLRRSARRPSVTRGAAWARADRRLSSPPFQARPPDSRDSFAGHRVPGISCGRLGWSAPADTSRRHPHSPLLIGLVVPAVRCRADPQREPGGRRRCGGAGKRNCGAGQARTGCAWRGEPCMTLSRTNISVINVQANTPRCT